MRGLLFFVGLLTGLWAIDQIAYEGQYSHVALRETTDQANNFRHRVGYWVEGILPSDFRG
jgi:hypothetical protein